jgi:hypothetical protein
MLCPHFEIKLFPNNYHILCIWRQFVAGRTDVFPFRNYVAMQGHNTGRDLEVNISSIHFYT